MATASSTATAPRPPAPTSRATGATPPAPPPKTPAYASSSGPSATAGNPSQPLVAQQILHLAGPDHPLVLVDLDDRGLSPPPDTHHLTGPTDANAVLRTILTLLPVTPGNPR